MTIKDFSWQPDEVLLSYTIGQLEQSLAMFVQGGEPSKAVDALDCIGSLSMLDREDTALQIFQSHEIDPRLIVDSAFSFIDAEKWEIARNELEFISIEDFLFMLEDRDSLAIVIEGVRIVMNDPFIQPILTPRLAYALAGFDSALAEHISQFKQNIMPVVTSRTAWASPDKSHTILWWYFRQDNFGTGNHTYSEILRDMWESLADDSSLITAAINSDISDRNEALLLRDNMKVQS